MIFSDYPKAEFLTANIIIRGTLVIQFFGRAFSFRKSSFGDLSPQKEKGKLNIEEVFSR